MEGGEDFKGAVSSLTKSSTTPFDPFLVPNWVGEACKKAFAGLSDEQIWDELRSRRFVQSIYSKHSDKKLLMKLAAEFVEDGQLLSEYVREKRGKKEVKEVRPRYM